MRKILFLILFFLFFLPFPALAKGPKKNLIPNPSFENDKNQNNLPDGWSWKENFAYPKSQGACFHKWDKESHSGKRSVSIEEDRWFSASEWQCKVKGIESRTWYLLSLWAKRDRPTGWLPKVILFDQSRLINLRSVQKWEYFEFLFNSEKIKDNTTLSLISYKKPYKVWFDDISLQKFSLKPITPFEEEITSNPKVYFSWIIPENNLPLRYSLICASDSALTRDLFKIEGIREKSCFVPGLRPGFWFWQVKVFLGEKLLAVSSLSSFRLVNSLPQKRDFSSVDSVEISPDGFLLVSKKSFFPIGISGLPSELARSARLCGFNTVLSPGKLAQDKSCGYQVAATFRLRRNNFEIPYNKLKPYTSIGFKIISPFPSEKKIRGNHLLAWYLYDEPEQRNISPLEVFRKYCQLKDYDPFHPAALVIYDPKRYLEYSECADIIMVDPYPVPVRPLSLVFEEVKKAREVSGQRPVWAILQAFDWKDFSAEAKREGKARLPTYIEERAMVFLAIVGGAQGIFFYTGGQKKSFSPEHFRGLKRIAYQLKCLYPFLTTSGGKEVIKAPFYLLSKEVPSKGFFLLAVNSSPSSEKLVFDGLPLSGKLRVLFENRKVKVEEGRLEDSFGPYAVHIYHINLTD